MPDLPKDEPFDIDRALAAVRVCTPDLGTLALDIRTTSFLSWLGKGEKAGSWTSGPAFVREFLKERAVRHEAEDSSHGPAPVPAHVVDELDRTALDRTAAAIVEVAAPYLQILDPENDDPLLGRDHSDVASGQAADIDEPTADLLALALRYLAADRERRRALVARLRESDGQIGRALGLAAARHDFPGKFGTIGPVFGSGAELHRLIELAQSPIAKIAREMASNDILSRAAAASNLLPYADRQVTALTQGLMLNSWLASNSVISLTRDARLDWVRGLNQTLGLGIQGGIAAAIGRLGIDVRLTTEAALAAAAIMRPGFQTVGTLALAGSVARGLAADVLGSYDLADVDAGELFTSVVSCVTLLDDDEATTAQRADALHRFMDLLGRFGSYVGNQVQQAGLIAILGLLVSLAAIYPDYRALYDSSDPKPSPELVETNARLRALAGQMESDRDRMASQRSRIRYVHTPSPLRVGPDRAAMRIRTVFPDQLVEVRDASGSWAKVAVFDYRADQEAIGWMSRRNLHVNPN